MPLERLLRGRRQEGGLTSWLSCYKINIIEKTAAIYSDFQGKSL